MSQLRRHIACLIAARRAARAAIAGAAMLAACSPAWAGAITLKPCVRLTEDRPVVLADIAVLTGEDAQALRELTVMPEPPKALDGAKFTVADLRRTLKENGAALGHFAITGSACNVYPPRQRNPETNAPAAESAVGSQATVEPAQPSGPTVRSRIIEVLANLLGTPAEDLRITFDERDDELLNIADNGAGGRRVSVQPLTASAAARMLVEVRLFEKEDVTDLRSVRVSISVRSSVLVLKKRIERDAPIAPCDVDVQERWMPAGGDALLSNAADLSGRAARARMLPGVVLRGTDLVEAVLIKRGELATVHCLRGGIEIKARARARSDGRRGEVIEFTIEGRGVKRKDFSARVIGPGRAVSDMDSTSGQPAGLAAAEPQGRDS